MLDGHTKIYIVSVATLAQRERELDIGSKIVVPERPELMVDVVVSLGEESIHPACVDLLNPPLQHDARDGSRLVDIIDSVQPK